MKFQISFRFCTFPPFHPTFFHFHGNLITFTPLYHLFISLRVCMNRLYILSPAICLWIITPVILSQVPDSLIPFDQAYKRSYHTVRLQGEPPVIDGKLEDPCWENEGAWSQNFIQNTPVERAQPTYPTRIKILFDDKNIYFALRAWDPEPDKINRFVGDRDDNSIGDLISVCFDSYHDSRAGTEFNINAGGNKTDLIVTDNLTVNLDWNAVWEGKTAINDSSWSVEFRIPLNQLRYNHSDTGMVWGLHVRRIVRRIQEVDQWSLIPRKNSGHVYSFGTMSGLQGVRKPRLVEFLPYVAGKATREPEVPGSPYAKSTQWNGNAGIDGKIGVGDFTMDITVNPDFGQIEADPSVMNLTALETFYEEKRPFFLEGQHIFDFSPDENMMFYSRRIGHVPSYYPEVDDVTSFTKVPEFTNIINAIKLTGTTRSGISVGILQSTTQKETAALTENGVETIPAVEPLTNFLVSRIQKITNKGNTQFGAMFTSTNRFIADSNLYYLNRNAYTAGIDLLQYTKDREYYLDFKGVASYINGKEDAMVSLQQNAVHYYQRPDAQGYLGIDSSRQSLSGTGGYLKIGRQGDKRFTFSEKLSWWSPGFDLNDAGFLLMADLIENYTLLSYRQTEPGSIFRNYTISLQQSNAWNYGGMSTRNDIGTEFFGMFNNRWEVSFYENYYISNMSTRLLRGGPAFRRAPRLEYSLILNTDRSRRVSFKLHNTGLASSDGITRQYMLEPGINFRIGNHFYIETEFEFTHNTDNFIYVTQERAGQDLQYIMAKIRQQTYNFTLRLNYNITPDISIQYYGSPFISSGIYSDFKRAADTHSRNISERYHAFNGQEITYDEATNDYLVSEGTKNYSFGNPDFSFREFRSNLVARWEYRPGSTLYLVWENNRTNSSNIYYSSASKNLDYLFEYKPTNILMVKLSFWLGM
jgi:hypothetical protein